MYVYYLQYFFFVFAVGFLHMTNLTDINLNLFRLAIQIILPDETGSFTITLKPKVTNTIYYNDHVLKSSNQPILRSITPSQTISPFSSQFNLKIYQLSYLHSPVSGGEKIMLFCSKFSKNDIRIRFFEVLNNELLWEAEGVLDKKNSYKNSGISFKTPTYKNLEIMISVQVYIQLCRPSDGAVSEPISFEYYPHDLGKI